MLHLKQLTGSALGLAAILGLGACSDDSLCDSQPGDPQCSSAPYYDKHTTQIELDGSQGVLDNRVDSSLTIKVNVQDHEPAHKPPANQTLAPPDTGAPQVDLQTDGDKIAVATGDVVTNSDRKSLTVKVRANRLGIGLLKIWVKVSETKTLQAETSSAYIVARSPLFGDGTELPPTPHVLGAVGFTGVQIGTVLGKADRLFFAEQFIGPSAVVQHWAELFGTTATSIAPDNTNATWGMIQKNLQESESALFAVTRDSLLIYDTFKGTSSKDLSLVWLNPTNPSRADNLTMMVPQIRTDRTALAASSDDQLILLGAPGSVGCFLVLPAATPPVVQLSKEVSVTGSPVLAAHAERTAAPKVAYGPYFGVAWGSDSKATLIQASAQTMMMSAVPLDDAAQASFAMSLNAEQITAAALGDLNGDGLEDLMVATSGGRFLWAPQQKDNHFAAARELNVKPTSSVTALSIGDVNSDGVTDLAVIANKKAFVYLGRGM